MTLPQVINLLRDLTEEAERVEAHDGVTWLCEARKRIVEEWDKELDEEADTLYNGHHPEARFCYYCGNGLPCDCGIGNTI